MSESKPVRFPVWRRARARECNPRETKHEARPPGRGGGRRRPADIWLPRGAGNRGGSARAEAVDLGFSSGLQPKFQQESRESPDAAIRAYERHKRAFLDTESKCEAQGFAFVPLVFEGHGGGSATPLLPS